MLFLYDEVYLEICDFEFNEIKNSLFISFKKTTLITYKKFKD